MMRGKSSGPEYRLLIIPEHDERNSSYSTLFVLETVQVFASFQYELSVKEELSGDKIRFTVLGLKTPQLRLPAAGHARFSKKCDGLDGKYEVTIEAINGRSTTFSIAVSPGRIHLKEAPSENIVEVVLDRTLWQQNDKDIL